MTDKFTWGLRLAVAALSPALLTTAVRAQAVAGHSLGKIHIGEACAEVRTALSGSKPPKSYDLKNGLTEDEWSGQVPNGTDSPDLQGLTLWYRQGKVVQIEYSNSGKKGLPLPSLSALLARDPQLKKVCYSEGFIDEEGGDLGAGGDVLFCFDDVKQGLAYGLATNGEVYLTHKPDRVIVHVAGVAFIARRGGVNIKRVTGEGAVIYRDEAAQAASHHHRSRTHSQ